MTHLQDQRHECQQSGDGVTGKIPRAGLETLEERAAHPSAGSGSECESVKSQGHKLVTEMTVECDKTVKLKSHFRTLETGW